jgi:hypothetical protein
MNPSCFSDRKGALYLEPTALSTCCAPLATGSLFSLTSHLVIQVCTQMFRCRAFKGTVQRDGRPILCSFDSVTVQA